MSAGTRIGRRVGHRRRPPAADLHVLPPGAGAGGAGGADAAHAGRPDHAGDRARLPACPSRPWRSASSAPSARSATPGIPYRVPPAHLLPERLDSVLRGRCTWSSTRATPRPAGDSLVRRELCDEAIRLGRLVAELMPDEPEALGLLRADAAPRRAARGARRRGRASWCCSRTRTGAAGTARGSRRASAARRAPCGMRRPGPYQLQAAIAAVHARRRHAGRHRLAADRALYDALLRADARRRSSSSTGPSRSRCATDRSGPAPDRRAPADGGLDGYHLYHAARADLLRRLGRGPEAAEAYPRALGRSPTRRSAASSSAAWPRCPAHTRHGCRRAVRGGPWRSGGGGGLTGAAVLSDEQDRDMIPCRRGDCLPDAHPGSHLRVNPAMKRHFIAGRRNVVSVMRIW